MPFERTYNEQLPVVDPPCVHLRSKAVVVTGEIDPAHLDEVDSHNQNCWCNMTQHVVGPDEGFVERIRCIPGRDCFQATH